MKLPAHVILVQRYVGKKKCDFPLGTNCAWKQKRQDPNPHESDVVNFEFFFKITTALFRYVKNKAISKGTTIMKKTEAQKITLLHLGLLSPKKIIDKMERHPYLAPEAARGCPRATAPPHVFSFSRGISRACSV
jgi:hypothetical protein